MERRAALKNIGGLLLAPALALPAVAADSRSVLRIAHLTDIHLKNKFDAPKRFEKCLHHVQKQSPKVDLILNGGDVVFDMNKENVATIDEQWKLMKGIMASECSIPVNYCLGNHDIWWNENDKGQALYGKKYSMDQLQLTRPYYSMQKNGWKIIVLDSVHLDIDDTWYIGKLGDEQFNWLEQELKSTGSTTPVLILSHIPILTATNLIQDDIVNRWIMYGGDMHTDTSKIIKLFYQYPNVKLCLSGHIHLREKLVYNNVTYICDGAVSGAWWEGNRRETAPGYGLIDLYSDGSFEERYINY
ncbi:MULTISPECIES: metallophosphoesterase [unclassified Mucilaginibacter]|uniref:metallophosphoesterase family protein n=1 Tax=unclassified Mucilaginibacter TaxID=2617802 RepID=UPI002AC9618D|nr:MULTISPECIES: metallophosphoesterase [unclassified Mucilaginibacter]MEB0249906.1 metallophosphoesterase [Mucilaginibacter sp. 5B2]MEB0262681.1 metallophosphoesterase [Mucilaginibacter sp. 10I4]MEB0279481.1 metallophosphoesterase [Mucilaginibacter sp. 10B2]MEB0300042.1 metallophosphoesterase [Mucilaginibacter sp. 5C4]WPX21855.1 metallophosphoesterase [Mucilaginibacter sp. 5C4]